MRKLFVSWYFYVILALSICVILLLILYINQSDKLYESQQFVNMVIAEDEAIVKKSRESVEQYKKQQEEEKQFKKDIYELSTEEFMNKYVYNEN